MKILISFSLLILLSLTAFSQKKPVGKGSMAGGTLPDVYSSVFDIRGFERFYILAISDNEKKSAEAIGKVLSREPSIKRTEKGTEAQFFIFYRETASESGMRVKYLKDKTSVVVWAEDRKTTGTETKLTEKFLKVLQRNKKLGAPDEPADAK